MNQYTYATLEELDCLPASQSPPPLSSENNPSNP